MSLSFEQLSHTFQSTPVLRDLSLKVSAEKITCLLGPSGSGKSTLLRLAAGLETVQKGQITLADELLAAPSFNPPPEARPIGLMFQDNALFPNMSVADNIAFGMPKQAAGERDRQIEALLEMVGLAGYQKRLPHQLSGGQQQRVTLARSLAAKPDVLLMDEPYASIDVTLRRSLREAARLTLKQSKMTAVLVTHDPHEAMEMADEIAVLDHGRIMQVGTPQELFERPAAVEVAKQFGAAQTLKAKPGDACISTEYGEIKVPHTDQSTLEHICCSVVRPEGLSLRADQDSCLRISDLRFVGDAWMAYLLPENNAHISDPLRVLCSHPLSFNLGDRVSLSANDSGFYIFEKGHELEVS